jgi:hypothetical protein
MHMDTIVRKAAAIAGGAALAIALSTGAGFAASSFVGKYKTEDTQGKEMTITLAEDGTATGQRMDESLTGKWKERKNNAVIFWEDGWKTKLTKKDDKYRKRAFKEGKAVQAADAEKIE